MSKCPCSCQPMTPKTDLSLISHILDEYAGVPGSLITILQKTQGIYGYLPQDAIAEISRATGIKYAKVMGVITFYAQFRLRPIGKHLIMVCQGTACHVNGSEKVAQALLDELHIAAGETTPDGLFTVENVACLGCCSMAPVMMIQTGSENVVHGPLTPNLAREVVRSIRRAEGGAE